jgi:site-specific DNA-methyltransferase (cytosine-N4-specific)
VDIFAGSNTTGSVAEEEGRKWLAFDESCDYLAASAFRFTGRKATADELTAIYSQIQAGEKLKFPLSGAQLKLA